MDPHAPITDPSDPHFGCDPTTIVVYEDGSSICDAPGADADYEAAAADVTTTTTVAVLPDTAADVEDGNLDGVGDPWFAIIAIASIAWVAVRRPRRGGDN